MRILEDFESNIRKHAGVIERTGGEKRWWKKEKEKKDGIFARKGPGTRK